jgi:hypothetical protein
MTKAFELYLQRVEVSFLSQMPSTERYGDGRLYMFSRLKTISERCKDNDEPNAVGMRLFREYTREKADGVCWWR